MGIELDQGSLQKAFQSRPDIQNAIAAASRAGPEYIELFNQISLHVCETISQQTSEPASKKRRINESLASRSVPNDTNGTSNSAGSAPATGEDPVLLEIKEISVVIPQRKKYTLCFTSTHLYARLPTSEEPVSGMSYAWKDIGTSHALVLLEVSLIVCVFAEYVFCLPVPEKSQKQYNYILFPKNSIISPSKPSPSAPPTPEPLVFTITDGAPKAGTIGGTDGSAASAVSDDYKSLLTWALTTRLKATGNTLKITESDPKLFSSAIRQSHRPSEKAVHVRAFRGSKDGYLFFLPTGILWGYKKPLLFLPHNRIAALSFTSVLQRTFNLSLDIDMSVPGGEDSTEEMEFQMIDQEDFAGINEFVQRYGLQDKSMAEQRKARRLNVNVVKDEEGNVVGNAEAGELEKAAQEAEQAAMDEEDEEEEDYDPGSEGESEGSGTSDSEEDDDENGEGGGSGDDEDEEDGEEEL
ncbi:Syntaxin-7 [Ciborinia camelliae]|nr:Syntaxin-7 [Ciborinia camelliae]